ncbi:MAG: hypothetical protein A2X31_00250 [Elusimicrobia bacterium GWB2_63_22]|nr:MAG: hypothetical protein A2X31_00250 [Elusimicrobia bacterium GWB2_63_22]
MKNLTAEELIRIYGLKPHPEGGFYRETYRSSGKTEGGRNLCTAIYFLLPAGQKSRMHRLKADELWDFYLGGPLTVGQLLPNGLEERVTMGSDPAAGQVQQLLVPAGCWFGAYPEPGTRFSLVGCTVAPGFEFDDFELRGRAALLRDFPASGGLITKLT